MSVAAGCTASPPPSPSDDAYDRRDGEVEYRVIQGTEAVLRVEVRIRGAAADQGLEEQCRAAVRRLGPLEAGRARLVPPYVVPEALIESAVRRDGPSASCVAGGPVFPEGGRPWGRG